MARRGVPVPRSAARRSGAASRTQRRARSQRARARSRPRSATHSRGVSRKARAECSPPASVTSPTCGRPRRSCSISRAVSGGLWARAHERSEPADRARAGTAGALPAARSSRRRDRARRSRGARRVSSRVITRARWSTRERSASTSRSRRARKLPRWCALNALSVLHAELGDLDRVERVLTVLGFVSCVPGFAEQPAVIDGASRLLAEVFGTAGRHSRSAIGVAALPRGSSRDRSRGRAPRLTAPSCETGNRDRSGASPRVRTRR